MQEELCALPGLPQLWLPLLWRLPDLQHLGAVCCSLLQDVSDERRFLPQASDWHIRHVLTPHVSLCSGIRVHLGEHNIAINEGTEQVIGTSKVIRHPRFNNYNLDNDIMLIKLNKPATLNQYVSIVFLPSRCPKSGTKCLISGWGNTSSSTSQ